jgi:hypothetical protein
MAQSPTLIVQVPRGGEADRQLSSQPPPCVTGGRVVVQTGPTDDEGRLEAAGAGQTILSLPAPGALERESAAVRRVIGQAGEGAEPIVLVLEAAEALSEEQLQVVVDAARHTSRAVILRVIADG